MSDSNDTIVNSEDSNYDHTWNWRLSQTQRLTIDSILIALTLATLTYGVTSWCILKKFRNYKNFVLLNAILSNFLRNILTPIYLHLSSENDHNKSNATTASMLYLEYLAEYFSTAKTHWLLIISHMFYADIVKVFSGNMQRRYLKSSIFGWGVSLITTAIFIYAYV